MQPSSRHAAASMAAQAMLVVERARRTAPVLRCTGMTGGVMDSTVASRLSVGGVRTDGTRLYHSATGEYNKDGTPMTGGKHREAATRSFNLLATYFECSVLSLASHSVRLRR